MKTVCKIEESGGVNGDPAATKRAVQSGAVFMKLADGAGERFVTRMIGRDLELR